MSAGSLQIFDTYERRIRPFKPIKAGHVGLYTCGPTVYNYAHIGNLRTYLFEDFLRRVLIANGYYVEHVMNITDVGHLTSDADSGDDKMELGAKKAGMSAWDLASFYTEAFQADLGCLVHGTKSQILAQNCINHENNDRRTESEGAETEGETREG